LAIYAADIQINVKNKGELRTLESRFKKIEKAAVTLSKTLKGLGRRNAIKVDTRAAMSAISALEARIRGLNRTVNLDARTRESRSGGGSSGAAMPIIAASLSNTGLSKQEKTAFDKKRRVTGGLEQPQERALDQIERDTQTLKTKLGNRSEVLAVHRDEQKKLQDQLAENNRKFNEATEKSLRGVGEGRARKLRRDKLAAIKKENTAINSALSAKQKDVEASLAKTEAINKEIRAQNEKARAIENPNRDLAEKLTTDKKVLTQKEKLNRAETALSKLETKKIHTGEKLKEIDEALTSEKKKLNTQLKKQENQLKKTTGKKVNYTKGISKGREEVAKLTAQSKKFNQVLQTTDIRMNKVAKGMKRLETGGRGGLFGKMMSSKGGGAALRGGAASLALIPGVAPLAVGGFAGAANGGGLGGAGIGVGVAALVQGTVALIEFSRQSAQVAADMDRMKSALAGVVPDQDAYNFALKTVKTLSDKYAISQKVLIKTFTGIQASADAAGVSIEDTAALFEGMISVTLAKGKGLEEFKGIALATQQILSKGRPQAEELRGQISERVPGFMAGLAESMNIEMSELDKRMQLSKVTIEDFIEYGKQLKIANAKIAQEMAQSMSFAGMRLTTAQENLQAEWGKTSMIFGSTFQDMGTAATKGLNKVAEAFNEVHKAELRRSIKHDPDWLFNLNPFTKNRKHQQERLDVLTGDKDVDTRTKKEKQLKAQEDASWQQVKKRLEIDIQYSKDKIELGEKEAEIKRKLAELELQFPDREDSDKADIKQLLKDLQKTEVDLRFDDAKKGFEEEIKYLQEKLHLGTKQADKNKELRELTKDMNEDQKKALEDQIEQQEKLNKALDGELITRGKIVDILDDYEDKLKELMNPLNQIKDASDAIGSAFGDAVRDVVSGTKSIGDAVVSMLDRIAAHFLDKAAEMMATQASNFLFKTISSALFSGGGMSWSQSINAPNLGYNAAQNLSLPEGFSFSTFSSGGYTDKPTKSLIGEGGEGEYVIKESQMAGAMSRWSQGNRGKAVIHGSDGGVGSNQAGGSTELVVNYTGPSLVFNEQEYVPKSAVPEIINSAARRGAEAGQSKVLSQLKNSRSQRARLGL